ncbi:MULTISPECIES: hypothetical protein [Microbacterium]|uniref:RCC1 domain-containing protein n=1 Tax=Microbacterium TaxID=33882 RepID=UPI00277EAFC2|nr:MULTISPECIES: hypothetical protein [Microbacterium]MDQ1074609.1 alpha-tubulin suppressor-like RCC1 family protein [Microbacterium sp. SORGH_AS_0969]MDQ1114837.1 alpha-tubulin suppressor-like RCC1 family protein [Microbacterium testaceum]
MRFSLSRSLRRGVAPSSARRSDLAAPLGRAAALAVVALLLVPVVGGSGAWFTDSRSVSGSASAATLGALSPTVAAAGAGNTVSWPAATTQSWATDAKVTDGVTYTVQRQVEGRPAQTLGTTSGTSFTDPGGQPFGMVSAGGSHSLAVDSAGSVWAWGSGADGRLGNGGSDSSLVPVPVSVRWPAGVTITQVSAGEWHSLAVDSAGSVWAWGSGADGRLGNGGSDSSLVPVPVSVRWPAGVTITQVSAGSDYSLALDSQGKVWAWGTGGNGRLGNGGAEDAFVPVPVKLASGITITQVSAGAAHSLAVDSSGQAWAWGSGGLGRLGNGGADDALVPVRVALGAGVTITQVSAGAAHSLAVDSSGRVWAWGDGIFGQLVTNTKRSNVPVSVPLGANTVTQVSAGYKHSLALDSSGKVWVWGGASGRIGDDSWRGASVPALVAVSGDTAVAYVSAGRAPSLLVTSSGGLWGWNQTVRTGDGSVADQIVPVLIGKRTFTQVSSSYSHSLALASDGSVWAWGSGDNGRLGNGSRSRAQTPVPVTPSWGPAVRITQVSAGFSHSLALASDGSVWAWGAGADGRLGNDTAQDSVVPVPVTKTWGTTARISQISAGTEHSLAVTTDGDVWAWGRGTEGQLGNGEAQNSAVPVPARSGLQGVPVGQVSAGGNRSLALTKDGAVWAWGDGAGGGLGDGDASAHVARVPRPVSWPSGGSIPFIRQVSAGQGHSLALTREGVVYAWGIGNNGLLGDGDGAEHSAVRPQPVTRSWGDGVSIAQVSAGPLSSLAVTSSGDVWGWGGNGVGQLGLGDIRTAYSTPKPMQTSWASSTSAPGIVQVSAAQLQSIAVASDGTSWAAGFDGFGMLKLSPGQLSPLPPQSFSFCAAPSTPVGRNCTLPGTVTYTVSYRYLGWASPAAAAAIAR